MLVLDSSQHFQLVSLFARQIRVGFHDGFRQFQLGPLRNFSPSGSLREMKRKSVLTTLALSRHGIYISPSMVTISHSVWHWHISTHRNATFIKENAASFDFKQKQYTSSKQNNSTNPSAKDQVLLQNLTSKSTFFIGYYVRILGQGTIQVMYIF